MTDWQLLDPGRAPSNRVIVATHEGFVTVADYVAGHWWEGGVRKITGKVTHWMPLPKPPQPTGETTNELHAKR